MKKVSIAEKIITAISVLILMWFVVSFFDITSHNTFLNENYGDYFDWNFFIVLEKFIEGVKG